MTAERQYGYLIHVGPNIAASANQLPLSLQPEKVAIKHDSWPHSFEWLAYYEGMWRRVHIQVNRTYIVHRGEKITIQIVGV